MHYQQVYRRVASALRKAAHGLPAGLAAMLVLGFWMIPAALDRAVLDEGAGFVKATSLVAAGMASGASWRLAGPIVQAFFAINTVWMTLAAGLLYQAAPTQLCSVYRADGQAAAGTAMVAWAIVGLIAWVGSVARNGTGHKCNAARIGFHRMLLDGRHDRTGIPNTVMTRHRSWKEFP